jgi:hypothetical protein
VACTPYLAIFQAIYSCSTISIGENLVDFCAKGVTSDYLVNPLGLTAEQGAFLAGLTQEKIDSFSIFYPDFFDALGGCFDDSLMLLSLAEMATSTENEFEGLDIDLLTDLSNTGFQTIFPAPSGEDILWVATSLGRRSYPIPWNST